MNYYPEFPINPLRRERIVDLAKSRQAPSLSEAPAAITVSEVAHSPEETEGGTEIDTEPGQ